MNEPRPAPQAPKRAMQLATQPKVLAGGLGASLATNIILVAQEFIPNWEPSVAFVGAVATLAALVVGWIKKN